MTERAQNTDIRVVQFLDQDFEISMKQSKLQVVLPPHMILGTEIPCPNTEGSVFIEKVHGDPEKTHAILIRCASAEKFYPVPLEGHSQCFNKTRVYVKYP